MFISCCLVLCIGFLNLFLNLCLNWLNLFCHIICYSTQTWKFRQLDKVQCMLWNLPINNWKWWSSSRTMDRTTDLEGAIVIKGWQSKRSSLTLNPKAEKKTCPSFDIFFPPTPPSFEIFFPPKQESSTKLSMKGTTMKLVSSNSSGYVIPKPSQSTQLNSEIESTISASLKPSPSSLPKPKNPPRDKPRRRSKIKRLKDHETGLAKFFQPKNQCLRP